MEAVIDTCSTVLHYNQMLKFRRTYGQKQVTDRENEKKTTNLIFQPLALAQNIYQCSDLFTVS